MLYYKQYFLEEGKDWVVFVHGAGGSSSIWFKQIRDFKQHFNVLLLDLRGHGRSKHFIQEYMQDRYTFKDISRDIIEVLDHLRIQQAHFVGISLGSIIIRSLGELDPSRIRSMVLGGAVIRLNVRSKFLMWFGNCVKRFVPYMWLYSFLAWVIMPRARHRHSRLLFIREAKRLYQKEFLRWYKLTSEVNPLLRYFNEKEIPIPTLYVMGDEDHMFLPQVQQVVKVHHHARLIVLPNCGHVVNIDQSEMFNQVSIQFLSNPQKGLLQLA
ncbi:alpha/beta fold hydrolase [Eisenibacter elegans]|jgi:pimeloyl-ACP methyl ester carboxylesterase|uniref:alpha/beta fold hydrolase n=1 Tax=Eisenibacter elegans TaxID=997 RepID=UPI0003FAA39A|nr:alpha/beta hydrolase [Eisenibacter elegans]